MRIFKKTNINFVGQRRIAAIISISLIVLGLGSIIFHGGLNLAIDFTGGTEALLKFTEPIDIGSARQLFSDGGFENFEVVTVGNANEILLRAQYSGNEFKSQLDQALEGREYETRRIDLVGPKIGQELSQNALRAIISALILILFYIMFRFDFWYAIGSVAALIHDILITLGIFSLLNLEINLVIVAAFLTIVGYSLNDTIVVYDRIRENIRSHARESLETIVNISLNGTLSRTVITSFTTLLVVTFLLIFGLGNIILFAFAMTIGVLVGTYSSIFVASPVMIYFENRVGRKLKKKK